MNSVRYTLHRIMYAHTCIITIYMKDRLTVASTNVFKMLNIKIGDPAKYGHLSSAISKVTLYYISECLDHISLCLA